MDSFTQITRGSVPNEIYLITRWFNDDAGMSHMAVFHSTNNGQTIIMKYSSLHIPAMGSMLPYQIIADPTPGYLYNWGFDGLWFSSDFGESWLLREPSYYGVWFWAGVNPGLIFKSNYYQAFSKSADYGLSFSLLPITITCPFTEVGFSEPEFYGINGQPGIGYDFVHTIDYGQTFTEKAIDSTVAFWQLSGVPPRIYRGSQPGEVYLSSWWPDLNYKIFYSYDTATSWSEQSHSTDLEEWGGGASFTPGIESGSFYVLKGKANPADPNQTIICIDYSTDYGETFTTYCHTLDSTTTIYTANAKIENALFELNAFPNPFSGSITIEYKLPGNCISPMLTITDLHGRVLRNFNIAGTESIQWDGTDSNGKPVANGLYFYTIQAGNRCSGFNKIAVFR